MEAGEKRKDFLRSTDMITTKIQKSGAQGSFCISGTLDTELMQLSMASLLKINMLNLKGANIVPEIRNLFLKYTNALMNNIPLKEETDHMVRVVLDLVGI